MRNKLIVIIVEYLTINPAVLFFIWKLYMVPGISGRSADSYDVISKGLLIFAVAFVLITLFIFSQIYIFVLKPYLDRIKELERAAEESKRAEVIRREFVANVTHELKTPLTSISGFIETLQDGASEDPEIRTKFIDIIAIETSRLKRLIEDLLVLSDIENRRETEVREFDVRKAVENTIEILKPIAEEKNIEIIFSACEDVTLKGSVDRFRQMMMNLIENAVKYSNAGGSVWVSISKTDKNMTISVRDEGIGIASEHHDRLFERFYRVDKSRSKKAGGTGLGLSIVKHIAALFGAVLKVESRVGEGSEFFVIFSNDA